jgi:predicted metal-dependent peptidase
MGRAQLESAQNEAVGALKASGVETVWFMDADTGAGKPRRVSVRDIPKLPITGRGGTNFAPAIAAAAKLRPRPKAIFYFTDGDGGVPPRPPPGIEIVWVVVRGHYNKRPAPWGHCIFVDE